MPKLHGFKVFEMTGTSGELHFAVINLAKAVEHMLAFPALNKYPALKSWSSEEVNNLLLASGKLRDTFGKIDRLLTLMDEARVKLVNFQSPTVKAEQIAAHQQAQQDFPLFLDAVLVYLKIFADCLANFTSQLLCFKKNHVPSHSFRDQWNWFLKVRRDADPKYAAILEGHTNWFITLAGDGQVQGLRDLIVHKMVRSDLLYLPGETPDQNRVLTLLYGAKTRKQGGTVINLLAELQQLLTGLFEFLDLYTVHFTERLQEAIGGGLPEPTGSLLYRFNDGRLASDWLYPQLT